jgi:hypothetical protein
MLFKTIISAALVASSFGTAHAQSKVLTPPPATRHDNVSVQGILQYGEFFGPPGYGEHPAADSKEYSFYLQLPATVTDQNPDLPLGLDFEKPNELFLQVRTTSSAMTAKLRRLIGKKVKATGSLEPSAIGHDRTGIIMNAGSVAAIRDWSW